MFWLYDPVTTAIPTVIYDSVTVNLLHCQAASFITIRASFTPFCRWLFAARLICQIAVRLKKRKWKMGLVEEEQTRAWKHR